MLRFAATVVSKRSFIYLYLSIHQDFRNISELWIQQTASVKEREPYLQDKFLVDVAFSHGGLEVRTLQETQKEFVHQLAEGQTIRKQLEII